MIDTRLWASTPFNNRTAMIDLMGMMQLFHVGLSQRLKVTTGNGYAVLPLGSGEPSPEWLAAVQQQFQLAAVAAGVSAPPDLETYDLADPSDFASWTLEIGLFSRTLAQAAGLH